MDDRKETTVMLERLGVRAPPLVLVALVLFLPSRGAINGRIVERNQLESAVTEHTNSYATNDSMASLIMRTRRVLKNAGWPVVITPMTGVGWRITWEWGWKLPPLPEPEDL